MGNYSTQKRDVPLLNPYYYKKVDTRNGAILQVGNEVKSCPQTTYSFRSGVPDEAVVTKADLLAGARPYGSRYDNGHSFHTTKYSLMYDKSLYTRRMNGTASNLEVTSPVIPQQLYDDMSKFATALPIPSFDATLWGNRAISDTSPSSSTADLSVFFGEFLRDGLPSFIGKTITKPGLSKRQLARKGGAEYLNLQFGWVPLIKDVEKMLHVVKNSYKILAQYQRDAGRHVRRSRSYEVQKRTIDPGVQLTTSYFAASQDPVKALLTPNFSTSVLSEERVKFSGAYTYYIPVDDSLLGAAAKYATLADKLLGIKLTPDRLWNLTPWSWLTDWWFEIGTALEARTALSINGQFLQYGYLQRRTDVVKTYNYAFRPHWGSAYVNRTAIFRVTRKERIRANPLGFGFTDDAISASQMAILAAVGISMGDGKLRKMGY